MAGILGLAGCGPAPPGPTVTPRPRVTESPPPDATEGQAEEEGQVAKGKDLYLQHCGACHGEKGDGQGLAARFLFPKPRDFRAGRFRLVSTTNGVPTQGDLDSVLVRGMPGSAMVPWAHLPPEHRKLLVEQVVEFRRQGIRDAELALAAEEELELTDEEIQETVDRLTAPAVAPDPPGAPAAPEAAANGRKLYLVKGCAACHGQGGKGDGQQKMVDGEGLPTRPRDLTRGIFKGPADFASVYRRIALGMPGSPMPASQSLTADEIGDLVAYVLSLSDEPTREAAVLKRRTIRAARVGKAPASPDDPAWANAPAESLPTVPLWWRDTAAADLKVRALHDGTLVALRLDWNDPQADRHAVQSESFEDVAAVELFAGRQEPFLGMGSSTLPVEMWLWDADSAGTPADVDSVYPDMVVDQYPLTEALVETAEFARPGTATPAQAEVTLPARAAGNQIVPPAKGRPASSVEAAGPGSVTFRPPASQWVKGRGVWRGGRWHVVFVRRLAVPRDGLKLAPGQRLSAAFAVWDGAQGDRDGEKQITIWQDLVLDP
jgi:mono/diheme cytochrome c family protein